MRAAWTGSWWGLLRLVCVSCGPGRVSSMKCNSVFLGSRGGRGAGRAQSIRRFCLRLFDGEELRFESLGTSLQRLYTW
jgi:hypothetical protein